MGATHEGVNKDGMCTRGNLSNFLYINVYISRAGTPMTSDLVEPLWYEVIPRGRNRTAKRPYIFDYTV